MNYEYELVYTQQIDRYLSEGWEPVPGVEHIPQYGFVSGPMWFAFLRRKKL